MNLFLLQELILLNLLQYIRKANLLFLSFITHRPNFSSSFHYHVVELITQLLHCRQIFSFALIRIASSAEDRPLHPSVGWPNISFSMIFGMFCLLYWTCCRLFHPHCLSVCLSVSRCARGATCVLLLISSGLRASHLIHTYAGQTWALSPDEEKDFAILGSLYCPEVKAFMQTKPLLERDIAFNEEGTHSDFTHSWLSNF